MDKETTTSRTCSKCQRQFRLDAFEWHNIICPGNASRHECCRCGRVFCTFRRLNKHLASVHGKLQRYHRYECSTCKAGFYEQYGLASHVCGRRKGKLSKKTLPAAQVGLKSNLSTAKSKTNEEGAIKYYCVCGLRYAKWEYFKKHVIDCHRDRPVSCTGCKKVKSYTSAVQVRAHMLLCIYLNGYPTVNPNIEEEDTHDKVNNEDAQQSIDKTNLARENRLEHDHAQPNQQSDEPSPTLKNIIATASLSKGGQIVAVRNVLDKKLSGSVVKKIENILTSETSIKTDCKTVENFGNDNDVSNCQPARKGSELSTPEAVSCDGVNVCWSGGTAEPDSKMDVPLPAFDGEQLTETSGFFSDEGMATYAQPQVKPQVIHQTQLCRSCGKIYSDGNFYAIEPEDLCECRYQFFCKLCQTLYKRVVELRQHLIDCHTFHKCLCGAFASASLLESHREYGMCPAEIIPVNQVI